RASESDDGVIVGVHNIALRAGSAERLKALDWHAGFFKFRARKLRLGVSQQRRLGEPPRIDHLEFSRSIPERMLPGILEISVVHIRGEYVFKGRWRDWLRHDMTPFRFNLIV